MGTRMTLNTSVDAIPMTRVMPTVRMGMTGTMAGAMRTENPITVVRAESKTAVPVVVIISTTASRYRSSSQSASLP